MLRRAVAVAVLVAAPATASADAEAGSSVGHGFAFGLEGGTMPVDTPPGEGVCGAPLFAWQVFLPAVTLSPRVGGCGSEHAGVFDAELAVTHSWALGRQVFDLFELTLDLGVVGGVSVVDADGLDRQVGAHGGVELGTTIDLPDPWTFGLTLSFQEWLPDDQLHPWTFRNLLVFGYRL